MIQGLERALSLLEAIAMAGGEARLAELEESLALDKATVHGLLNTMLAMGYVSRRGTREYLYIDALEGARSLRVASPRGRREGLTTSAIGKIFLAHDSNLVRRLRQAHLMPVMLDKQLPAIVEKGYALDLEEAEPGLNCLALPLRQQGRVVAALGVAGPAKRLSKPVLRRMAAAIMHDLFDIIKL